MKYILLILLGAFLLSNLAISKLDLFSWFWFSAPVLIVFLIELVHLKNNKVSRAAPITMVVLYPLGFIVFLFEHYSSTTDAQAGLATALMPVYQLIIVAFIIIVGLIKYVFSIATK